MKILCILASAVGLFATSLSYAGSISCVGDHFGYQFHVSARTRGERVVGHVSVNINQGGRSVKRSTLTPTTSDIRENQHLRFSASGADGSGTLNTAYAGGGYSGTLLARTNYGTFNVDVNCRYAAAGFEFEQTQF